MSHGVDGERLAQASGSHLQGQLRQLPGVDVLLQEKPVVHAASEWPHPLVVEVARTTLASAREGIVNGATCPSREELAQGVVQGLAALERRLFTPVMNATGVVLHTNLGRAPLSAAALQAVHTAAGTYNNLEYDIATGSRGSRHVHGEELLCRLTGAEAALVVNNNAAAVLLVLSAVARGGEVVLSRGELIEIGGAFRIPEIMAQSGCTLREVGTTNRTHLSDYQQATGEGTTAILKVHTSNYRVVGFTSSVSPRELAPVARDHGIPLLEDLGSGVLVDTTRFGLGREPTVQEAVDAGADLVTFSGDKLLGGPQAGVIVGRRDLVDLCRRHPLARALRVDKMTLAALQATLLQYLKGSAHELPIYQMLSVSVAELDTRAQRLAEAICEAGDGSWVTAVVDGVSTVGGGSLPGETLPTRLVAVRPPGAAGEYATALRQVRPPVITRIEDGAVLFDLRTVPPADDDALIAAAQAAIGAGPANQSDGGRT